MTEADVAVLGRGVKRGSVGVVKETHGLEGTTLAPVKRSKYGAVKTTVDGIVFDSKREATHYQWLRARQAAGEIRDLELQPRFELTAGPTGTTLGEYVGDFRYVEDDTVIVEDVKGFKTPLYRWKKKHVEAQYDIEIRER